MNTIKEIEIKLKKLEKDHHHLKITGVSHHFNFFNFILDWIIITIPLVIIFTSFTYLFNSIFTLFTLTLFWSFGIFLFSGGYKGKKEFLEFILLEFCLIGPVLLSLLLEGEKIILPLMAFIYSIYLDTTTRKHRKEWESLTSKINHIRDLKIHKEKEKDHKEKEKFEASQRKKGFELFEDKWVKKTEIPKLKGIKLGLDKNFQNISSYDFEKFIAKLFKAMGYETRVTQASNDYGIDVIAKKEHETIAIQCKRYRPGNSIGNNDIQKLLGAMQHRNIQANHSIIITTSHFTVQAKEQAKECAIELWDNQLLKKMVKKYLMEI